MILEEDVKAMRCRYHPHYFSGDDGGTVRAANASGAHVDQTASKFKCKHSREDLHMEIILFYCHLCGYRTPNWHSGNTAQSS